MHRLEWKNSETEVFATELYQSSDRNRGPLLTAR